MVAKKEVDCTCPIESVAMIVGSKWVVVLLRDMFVGRTHFKDFLEANPGLSNKVLSEKLKEMSAFGLVEKYFDADSRVSYRLTEHGRAFKGVMRELVQVGKSYCKTKSYSKLLSALA